MPNFNKAIQEIREVCQRHGIVLVGTCNHEGIFGEITMCAEDNTMVYTENNHGYMSDRSFNFTIET